MKEKILNYQFGIGSAHITPKQIIGHPLFSGSAVMVFGSNIANFFAYIYHLIIGRYLGPEEYGELAATITFIGMVVSIFSFLGVVIVKFTSASNENERQNIIGWFSKISLYLALGVTFALVLLTPVLSDFFHIHPNVLVLVAPIVGLSLISYVLKSFLQGMLSFVQAVVATNIEMIGRFLLALVLIVAGFGVWGAIIGLLLAIVIEVLYVLFALRKYKLFSLSASFQSKRKVIEYALPIFISALATNSLLSTDVLLSKHYFDSFDAGLYASLSNLGKIIFFGTAPISSVMFPLLSKGHAEKTNTNKVFYMTLGISSIIALGITLIYKTIPNTMIHTLYGEKFTAGAQELYLFGIYISLFTIGSIFLNYFLSKNMTKVVIFAVIAALFQVFSVRMYHSSIAQVVQMSIISAVILNIGLIGTFIYDKKIR
jgi:O-antigen/teichoic acid export membrane protein